MVYAADDPPAMLRARLSLAEEVLRCIAFQRRKLNGGPADLHLAPMLVRWAEEYFETAPPMPAPEVAPPETKKRRRSRSHIHLAPNGLMDEGIEPLPRALACGGHMERD